MYFAAGQLLQEQLRLQQPARCTAVVCDEYVPGTICDLEHAVGEASRQQDQLDDYCAIAGATDGDLSERTGALQEKRLLFLNASFSYVCPEPVLV